MHPKYVVAHLVAATALSSPVLCLMYARFDNVQDHKDRAHQIDKRESYIFDSIAGCQKEGFSASECEQSWKSASKFLRQSGTKAFYGSLSDCFNVHGDCGSATVEKNSIRLLAALPVPGTPLIIPIIGPTKSKSTIFYPKNIGWQAAKSDINISVPVFPAKDGGRVVRADGKYIKKPSI